MRPFRSQHGNMVVLTTAVAAVIFVPVLILAVFVTLHLVNRERAESVVEAASKVAARDLSRIVLKTDRFGFVALSNYEPGGQRTRSKDDEPLPVVSLHAWQAAITEALDLAKAMHNQTIAELAKADQAELQQAVFDIRAQMEASVMGDPRLSLDRNGQRVDTLHDVERFLAENMPAHVKLVCVKLTVGCPADGTEGIDQQTHLVSSSIFGDVESKQIPSLVKLQCTFRSTDQASAPITATAYSQAFCEPDRTSPGTMNVRFPGRPVLGLLSWNEFMTEDNFNDNQVINFDVVEGDFPIDRDARLKQIESTIDRHATPRAFARHLYYWLLTAHGRLKKESVLAMMTAPFSPYPNQAYTYSISADGGITRYANQGIPGSIAVAADGEFVSMADTRVKSGASVVVLFHDNVENLNGDTAKHGGRPLQGLALDIEVGGTGDSNAHGDMMAVRERTKHRRV